jgi:hypothetical protein
MTRTSSARVVVLTVVGLMVAASMTVIAQSAQAQYQRALVEEHANGDLKQAITLYEQAAKAARRDRSLAAKALMRKATSLEKLGRDAEAVDTYADLVRAYPEQRNEVAVAQERLTALRPTARHVSDAVAPAERVSEMELASRLATFVWNAAPDAPLLDAAQRGELRDGAALNLQVARMLRDPRSAALVDRFFSQWLALDRLRTARPDPLRYPQADARLLQAMEMETRLFLQSQLREDRDAVELWTASYTYVNERLARHYGLSGVTGNEFRRVAWPDANRAGLLGQAGPLTMLSFDNRTSPTVRGVYVLTRFLGGDAPDPPANVPPLADRTGGRAEAMRNRMMAHRSNPACASCHAAFDPFGFAFENFDAIGAWRTTDDGAPIDPSGNFSDGTRFNGPIEFRAGLLKYRDSYYAGVTGRLMAHALGREGTNGRVYDHELPAVRKVVRDAASSGHRWSSIIGGIVASTPFQAKSIVP